WLLWIAVIFSLVNLILGTLLRLLSLPLIIITFGLMLLVINTALLAITAGLTKHLDIDNFGAASFGALLISVFSWLAELLLPTRRREKGEAKTYCSAALCGDPFADHYHPDDEQ